jgi:hypothetical protein
VFALVAVLAAGVASATAASQKRKPAPCWKTLINDWYDGRIDGTYAIHCYRDALKHLPTDVQTYSSAREDIMQALQERLTQGHSSSTTGKHGGKSGKGGVVPGRGGGGKDGKGGTSGVGTNPKGPRSAPPGPINSAFRSIGPSKATSVPIPLIVLGGVALLLMAAGGAGFLARRTRVRRVQLASLPKSGRRPPQQQP